VETGLHELLKEVVFTELEREGYHLYVEPAEPPSWRLHWSQYRPDIFGVFSNEVESLFVLVECETNPGIRRIRGKISKIRCSLNIQKRLNERHVLRLLLVIPSGMLRRVNCPELRKFWDIWIINPRGEIIHKIPRKEYTNAA